MIWSTRLPFGTDFPPRASPEAALLIRLGGLAMDMQVFSGDDRTLTMYCSSDKVEMRLVVEFISFPNLDLANPTKGAPSSTSSSWAAQKSSGNPSPTNRLYRQILNPINPKRDTLGNQNQRILAENCVIDLNRVLEGRSSFTRSGLFYFLRRSLCPINGLLC